MVMLVHSKKPSPIRCGRCCIPIDDDEDRKKGGPKYITVTVGSIESNQRVHFGCHQNVAGETLLGPQAAARL